jgi:hypothetical protein
MKMKKNILFSLFICVIFSVYGNDANRREDKCAGYLFAYFEGSGDKNRQEQLRFGVSADAVNWFALNNNQPIIPSDEISQTGDIRDPHILRGEDGKTFPHFFEIDDSGDEITTGKEYKSHCFIRRFLLITCSTAV